MTDLEKKLGVCLIASAAYIIWRTVDDIRRI